MFLPRKILRKKFLNRNAQSFGKENNLAVCNAADLGFDFCDRVFADIPSHATTTRSKHCLCQLLLVADPSDYRSDNVLWRCLAHVAGLTVFGIPLGFLPISEFDSRRVYQPRLLWTGML